MYGSSRYDRSRPWRRSLLDARRVLRRAFVASREVSLQGLLGMLVVAVAAANIGLYGLISRAPARAATTVTLDFSSDSSKDSDTTTADWDTAAGTVGLPLANSIQFSGTISSDLNESTVVPDDGIYGAAFVSSSTGYVAGTSGKVWKTTDSGYSWTALTSPESGKLIYDIDCTDATTCWVVNEDGDIYRTANSGTSWTQQRTGSAALLAIDMVDATTGYAGGGSGSEVMVKTVNGGDTWSSVTTGGTDPPISALVATSTVDVIYMGALGALQFTNDGGSNFTASSATTTGAFVGGHALAASAGTSTVWAAYTFFNFVDPVVLKSADGGANFTQVGAGFTTAPSAMGMSSDGSVVVGCAGAECRYSTDGGATWTASTISGTLSAPYSIEFVSATSFYIADSSGTATFGYSVDSGANIVMVPAVGLGSWSSADSIKALAPSKTASSTVTLGFSADPEYRRTSNDFTGVTTPTGLGSVTVRDAECTDTNCVAGTSGGAYYSAEGGSAWSQATISGGGAFSRAVNAVALVGTDTAYAVTVGDSTDARIYRSTDGGATYTLVHTLSSDSSFISVDCASATVCWAIAKSGVVATLVGKDQVYIAKNGGGTTAVFGTTDGTTWAQQLDLSGASVTPASRPGALAAISTTRAYFVGSGAGDNAYRTTDGSTWSASDIDGGSTALEAIECNGSGNCFAGGASGYLVYTNDSGANWSSQTTSLGSATIQDIEFGDDYRAYLGTSVRGIKKLTLTSPASPTYQTTATVRTTALDSTSDAITDATLTITSSTPTDTSITSFLSNDGGTTWTTSTPGVALTFPTAGSDLRYRADFTTSDTSATPSIDSISISFNTLVVTQNLTSGGLQLSPVDAFDHLRPRVIPDAGTGVIAAWEDYRHTSSSIYVQRVSSAGTALWGSGGQRLAASSSVQYQPQVIEDGSGGALVFWAENHACDCSGSHEIVGMRIDSDGATDWGPTTIMTSSTAAFSIGEAVSDGSGGAILTYYQSDDSLLRAKRIDSSGGTTWTAQVTDIATFSIAGVTHKRPYFVRTAVDTTNGYVFIAFTEAHLAAGGTSKAYVQRLALSNGALGYGASGTEVESMTSAASLARGVHILALAPNTSGGFVVAILGRSDADGNFSAENNLRVMYGAPGSMSTTTIFTGESSSFVQASDNGDGVFDDDGNIYFAHGALNASSERTVLLYKVAPTGTNLWGSTQTDGTLSWTAVEVASNTGIFPKPRLTLDGSGGVFISWLYEVAAFTTTGVRMQHVTAAAAPQWPTASTAMGEGDYDGTGDEFMHQPITVTSSSAFVVWDENNIFIQSVSQSAAAAAASQGSATTGGTTEDTSKPPREPAAKAPEARTDKVIRWRFEDRSSLETGFVLRIEKADEEPQTIFTTEPIETKDLSYIDETGLAPNTRYCGRVIRTFSSKGLSDPTELPCAYTLATQPRDVVYTVPGAASRQLRWDPAGNSTSTEFAVLEKESGKYVQKDGTLGDDPLWQPYEDWGGKDGVLITGLDAKGTYTLQVLVRNAVGIESIPVTAGEGKPLLEQEGGEPELTLAKSLAINPFGAALAAIGMSAATAGLAGLMLLALAVMAFAVLHRRAGARRCVAGLCRLASAPTASYAAATVAVDNGPSYVAHRRVHRTGQVAALAAVLALVVQAVAYGILTYAPGTVFGAESFTGDGKAVIQGDVLAYQLVIKNSGTGSATSLTLTDALPFGVSYQPGSLTVNGVKQSDVCDNDAACFVKGAVRMDYPSVQVGDAVIITFNAKVTIAPGQGSDLVLLRNTACVTAKQLKEPACSNETINPVVAPGALLNANVNAPPPVNGPVPPPVNAPAANAPVNAPRPPSPPVNQNVNVPTDENLNVPTDENLNVNAPAEPEQLPEEPVPAPEEKTTQITINGEEPSVEAPVNDSTPEIGGTSAPGSLVLLRVDGLAAGVAYTAADGRFVFGIDAPLGEGEHVVSVFLDGEEIDRAAFAVDTVAPVAPQDIAIDIVRVDLSIITRLTTDVRTQDATIVVSGRTSPDTRLVRIRVESDPIEVEFVPPSPVWSREITGRFDPGEHTVTALAFDAAGNVSASARETFEIPAPPPLATPLALLDDPAVEEVSQTVIAPAVVAVAAVNVAAAAGIPTLFNFLGLLFTQPSLLFARRERKGYGTVFNSLSKLPIDLAIVRLREEGTNRVVQTKVTDRLGRYVFFLKPGRYALEVTKPGFTHPSAYLAGKTEDVAFTDILPGRALAAAEPTRFAKNLPADPAAAEKAPAAIRRAALLRKLQYAFALSGPVVSAATVIIIPSLTVVLLAAFQLLTFALFRRLAYKKPPKSQGIVRDKATGKPLTGVVVRVFETTYQKLLETAVTDARGRYAFLVGPNRYYVTASLPGYRTAKSEELDFTAAAKGGVIARDVELAEGVDQPQPSAPPATGPTTTPAPPAAPRPMPSAPPATGPLTKAPPQSAPPATPPLTPPTA